MKLSILKDYGIDYEKGVARCLNDAELYGKILEMFLEDTALEQGKAALAENNADRLFRAMHDLKGSSGNAALEELYSAVCPLVELLRGGNAEKADILRLFAPVEAAYSKAREGIQFAIGG